MAIDKFKNDIISLANTIAKNEKLLLPFLEKKASDAAIQFPYDHTSLAMYNVIKRLASKNLTITRADLIELYNSNYTSNNKFASVFSEELGLRKDEREIKTAGQKTVNKVQENIDTIADPILLESLGAVFGDKLNVRKYNVKTANTASIETSRYLNKLNLSVKSSSVLDGDNKFLIVNSEFETPKGDTNILLPVQIIDDKVLAPSVFVTNAGVQDLNSDNVVKYVLANTGKRTNIKASDILKAISNMESKEIISNVSLAATKLASTKETMLSGNQILGQELVNYKKDLEVPKIIDNEFSTFTEKFASAVGVASFKFGNDKVLLGKNLIAKKLASFGYKNSQIKVLDVEDKNVIYAVAIDNVSFRVPVKLASEKVLNPEVIISNGSLKQFNSECISELFGNEVFDSRASAVNSKLYGLKPSELLTQVKQAMLESNYAKAEDALNLLQDSGDVKAYAIAFEIYSNGLSGITKQASEQKVCNKQIKVATSSQPICSHTNLPVNKTYVDKHGCCRPLYRKDMEETYQVASFATKVFF